MTATREPDRERRPLPRSANVNRSAGVSSLRCSSALDQPRQWQAHPPRTIACMLSLDSPPAARASPGGMPQALRARFLRPRPVARSPHPCTCGPIRLGFQSSPGAAARPSPYPAAVVSTSPHRFPRNRVDLALQAVRTYPPHRRDRSLASPASVGSGYHATRRGRRIRPLGSAPIPARAVPWSRRASEARQADPRLVSVRRVSAVDNADRRVRAPLAFCAAHLMRATDTAMTAGRGPPAYRLHSEHSTSSTAAGVHVDQDGNSRRGRSTCGRCWRARPASDQPLPAACRGRLWPRRTPRA